MVANEDAGWYECRKCGFQQYIVEYYIDKAKCYCSRKRGVEKWMRESDWKNIKPPSSPALPPLAHD